MADPWKAVRDRRLQRESDALTASVATEEQVRAMLTTLKGDRGPKGDKGDRGDTGPKGEAGKVGASGPEGKPGPMGERGVQGDRGVRGDAGPKGDVGADGEPGQTGPRGFPGPHTIRSEFVRGVGQRIDGVVEYLSDGSTRTFTVRRDSSGRPEELSLG